VGASRWAARDAALAAHPSRCSTADRGAPKADVAALEDPLLRVSAMVEAHPELAELECNPVVVTLDGVTIVDVRARIHPAPHAVPSPSVQG
jgi:acetate---CoA ligase (ADP-forming)